MKSEFCYSQLDEIVGKKNLLYAVDRLKATTEFRKDCGHNYFTDAAKACLTEFMLDMKKRETRKALSCFDTAEGLIQYAGECLGAPTAGVLIL